MYNNNLHQCRLRGLKLTICGEVLYVGDMHERNKVENDANGRKNHIIQENPKNPKGEIHLKIWSNQHKHAILKQNVYIIFHQFFPHASYIHHLPPTKSHYINR